MYLYNCLPPLTSDVQERSESEIVINMHYKDTDFKSRLTQLFLLPDCDLNTDDYT